MSVDYQALLNEGQATCTLPDGLKNADPIHGSLTFHTIITIVSGIFVLLTLLFTSRNTARHLRSFTCPNEQRQIVRLLWTPFMFGLFNFLGIAWYEAAYYLEQVGPTYEALCLVGLFLLFIALIIPTADDRATVYEYFNNLDRANSRGKKKNVKHERGSLRWFYVEWLMVFQVIPMRIGLTIAMWVVHAKGCPLDEEPTVFQVLEPIYVVTWAVAMLRLYHRLHPQLKARNAFAKFFCFKLIVLLQVIQTPIFDNVLSGGSVEPSSTVSYEDLNTGVPALILCCEMLLFSFAFLWAFGAKPYMHTTTAQEQLEQLEDAEGKRPVLQQQKLPAIRALALVLDLRDILSGYDWHRKIPVILSSKNLPPRTLQRPQMARDQQQHYLSPRAGSQSGQAREPSTGGNSQSSDESQYKPPEYETSPAAAPGRTYQGR